MGLGRSVRGAHYRAGSNQNPASLPSPSACSGGRDWPARAAGGYRRAMYSLSPGRRRRSATCQWLWTYSQGCSRACQIKPGHSVAAAVIGVQRGAGLGWHGPRVDLLARRDLGGSGAVALAFARACSAGPSPVWRIASVTRLRRSRGHRTERGLTAGRHHCGRRLGVPASTLRGLNRARGPRWAASAPAHPPHPASGLLTSGRRSANGPAAGRCHRTPRRGLRAGWVTRRSRSVTPCQSRSRRLAPARA